MVFEGMADQNTYFKGDSGPLSASALRASSNGLVALAQARSNSMRLWAHLEAISSKPDLL